MQGKNSECLQTFILENDHINFYAGGTLYSGGFVRPGRGFVRPCRGFVPPGRGLMPPGSPNDNIKYALHVLYIISTFMS